MWRTVRFAAAFPLWGDEAFLAVSIAERGAGDLTRPLEYWQVAPWGFLAVEHASIRLFGLSEWAFRLVPFLSGIAVLILFARFASRSLDRRAAMLAVGFLAASYFPVRHSAEVKPYALDLLISLALTSLAWDLWHSPRSSRRWLGLIGVAGVGVWCSFPAVFVAGAAGVLLSDRVLRDRSWRSLMPWVTYGIVLLASWSAMFTLSAAPQAQDSWPTLSASTWDDAYPPVDRPSRLPWWFFKAHAGYMMAYPVGGSGFSSIATLVFVSLGAIHLWRTGRRVLLALLLSPLPLNLAAAALRRYPYGSSPRVALYMAPAFCLLAAVGLTRWTLRRFPRRLAPTALLGIVVLFGLGSLIGTAIDVAAPYRRPDDLAHRRVVASLASRTRPGDRWLTFDGSHGRRPTANLMVAPWLQQEAEVRFYLAQLAPVPSLRVDGPSDPALSASHTSGRTWLIVHHSGWSLYPESVAAATERALAARLGPAITRLSVNITNRESIVAYVFPAHPAPTIDNGGTLHSLARPGPLAAGLPSGRTLRGVID